LSPRPHQDRPARAGARRGPPPRAEAAQGQVSGLATARGPGRGVCGASE